MAKPEWGIKRICQACGKKFYDLKNSPIICPYCGVEYDPQDYLRTKKGKNISSKTSVENANDLAKNIDDIEVIFEILRQLVNDKDFENIKSTFHKEKTSAILKDNTIEAFKKNIFGVPSFIFNNQIFWGQDRIFFLEKEISKIYA